MLFKRICSKYRPFIRTCFTLISQNNEKQSTAIAKQLFNKIKATGPITVADYMKEVLINPSGGYYMHKNVFGHEGDFITSPELSQMFGEMVAIWCINEWSKTGSPKPFQIVELGPGRGRLSQDILRVFKRFEALNSCSLNLVEVSPYLSNFQARTLCSQSNNVIEPSSTFYKEGISLEGVPVRWFRKVEDVPDVFTILVAHEFFDALPVHKFQKTENGYREVLIDIGEEEGSFRYILARNETPASKTFIKPTETREHLEVSPDSMLVVETIVEKIKSFGGLALIADYGNLGDGLDTFRAFKDHKLHDPLIEPGTADLTADVDFGRLKEIAEEGGKLLVCGPVSQREFLLKMGIEQRYQALVNKATKDQLESLKFSYDMMLDEKQMGSRFKFMCFAPATMKVILDKFPVVGFS